MPIETLRKIASGELAPPRRQAGLCWFLDHELGRQDLGELLKKVVSEWPEFSGSKGYPVPGGEKAYYSKSLWDVNTEYGQSRRRLCGWFADYLEKNNDR